MKLDVAPQELKTIQALLKQYVPHTRVWAFGSRVKFTAHPASDLDLVAFISKEQELQFSLLKEALEESDLPFRVDLHDWNELPETFHKNIRSNYVEIQSDKKLELLGDWKTYRLGEIALVQTGPFGSQLHSYDYQEIGIPVIMPTNIGDNKVIENGIARISKEKADSVSRHFTKEGDIVYSRRGDIERKAYITSHEDSWICGTGCLKIRPKRQIVNPKYLSYFLGTSQTKDYLRANAIGTTMPNLNTSILASIEILVPDLPAQIQIAQILSSLDDKIELNLQMNQTLENMAQAIFKEWFVDFNFPGFDGELVDGVPKGWRKVKVNDLCQVNASTLNSKDDIKEVHYIEISEVERGIIKNIKIFERGSEPSRAKRKLQHGDTVLSTVRPDRGSYFLSLYPTENMIASTGFAVFSPTLVPFSFLYLLLTSEEQLEYYGKMADGAAYPAINQSVIMDIDFVLPTTEILTLFHNMAGNSLIKLFNNLTENKILSETRDTLLPKLMSGQVEIA